MLISTRQNSAEWLGETSCTGDDVKRFLDAGGDLFNILGENYRAYIKLDKVTL